MTVVPGPQKLRDVKLSERLKIAHQRSGLSLRALSAAVGQSEEWLQTFIRRDSKRTDAATLEAVAAKAGVSEAWLIHGRGSPDDVAPEVAATTAARRVWAARREEAEQRAKERGLVIRWWAWDECLRMFADHNPDDVPLEAMVQVAHALDGSSVGKPRGAQVVTGAHESKPAAGGTKGG